MRFSESMAKLVSRRRSSRTSLRRWWGLVDDEDGQLPGLLCEAGDLGPDRVMGRGAGPLDGEAELPGDGLVDVEHVAGGERDVVDAVEAGVELVGEVAADGCLAGPDLAGDGEAFGAGMALTDRITGGGRAWQFLRCNKPSISSRRSSMASASRTSSSVQSSSPSSASSPWRASSFSISTCSSGVRSAGSG